MKSLPLLAALLLTLPAAAQVATEGASRISVLPGWRWTPNDHFAGSAARAGFPRTEASSGGPQLTAAFGYMATSNLEIAIDLFAGFETLSLETFGDVTSVSYGALLQLRSVFEWGPVNPYLGIGLGPTLVLTDPASVDRDTNERLLTGYTADAGVTFRLSEALGLTLFARWLLARGFVPEVGGINAGGLWGGLGITFLLPGEPSRPGAIR